MDEEQLKVELARELHRGVTHLDPDIWAQLVDDREVNSVLDVHETLDLAAATEKREWDAEEKSEWDEAIGGLAGRYRSFVKYDKRRRAARENREAREASSQTVAVSMTDVRLDALAEILALDAAGQPEVQQMRSDLLGHELLDPAEVPAWIERRDEREGEASEGSVLRYPRGTDQEPGKLLVKAGGDLDELRELVGRLIAAYTWTETAALSFVLSGETPPLSKARAAIRRRAPYEALSRIVIEADARTSTREIASLYAQAHAKLHGEGRRKMSDKHIALALFGARHRGHLAPGGATVSFDSPVKRGDHPNRRIGAVFFEDRAPQTSPTWRQLLERWNREHLKWAYATRVPVQHFAHDVRIAWERVTGCRWIPPKDAEDARDAPGEEL